MSPDIRDPNAQCAGREHRLAPVLQGLIDHLHRCGGWREGIFYAANIIRYR